MPSRFLSLGIVVFWLAMTAVLLYREAWPLLQPDMPPPFTIDLVDEAQQKMADTRWSVFLKGTIPDASGTIARTKVDYLPKSDTFVLNLNLRCVNPTHNGLSLGSLTLRNMTSNYRVNRKGQLLGMEAEFLFDVEVARLKIKNVNAFLTGDVEDDQFRSRYRFRVPGLLNDYASDLKPVKVSYHGSILMPMHPVNRIKGLRPGQHWRMPILNPLADALSGTMSANGLLGSESEIRYLNAHVRPNIEMLPGQKEPVPCHVIEYEDEELQPLTWVQEGSGLVLQQEATLMHDSRIVMRRDPIPRD
jgi:hypothetical protein